MTKTRAVQEAVPVDYNAPGCPPDADTTFYVLAKLAQDASRKSPRASVGGHPGANGTLVKTLKQD